MWNYAPVICKHNPMGLGTAETYLSIYTVSPSLLSIMHRAAWGGGKPVHIWASLGYACETTATRRRQPNHIHSNGFFPYKYFVPGWTRTRTEEACSSVVKYSPLPTELYRRLSAKFWPQHHSMPKLAEVISHLTAGIWAGLWPGIRLSLQCQAYTRALQWEKSISLLFPGAVGVVTNDWYLCRFGHGMESKALYVVR